MAYDDQGTYIADNWASGATLGATPLRVGQIDSMRGHICAGSSFKNSAT
jgi:hypothetical protein